jgi:hypothetical protein
MPGGLLPELCGPRSAQDSGRFEPGTAISSWLSIDIGWPVKSPASYKCQQRACSCRPCQLRSSLIGQRRLQAPSEFVTLDRPHELGGTVKPGRR